MTTEAAAAQYLAQHRMEHAGRGWRIHNPHNKSVTELPVIYGFNNGGPRKFLSAVAMAEDGTVLGGHCCSHEGYMEADLGIVDGWMDSRHEESYKPHYPDGYRMEFVGYNDVKGHAGLQAAIARHAAASPVSEGGEHG